MKSLNVYKSVAQWPSSPGRKLVHSYLLMCRELAGDLRQVRTTDAQMACNLGMSRSQVIRALQQIRDDGFIEWNHETRKLRRYVKIDCPPLPERYKVDDFIVIPGPVAANKRVPPGGKLFWGAVERLRRMDDEREGMRRNATVRDIAKACGLSDRDIRRRLDDLGIVPTPGYLMGSEIGFDGDINDINEAIEDSPDWWVE